MSAASSSSHLSRDLGERDRVHLQHARGAHRVFRFREDLRAHRVAEPLPQHVAFHRGQRLQQQRDVGRVHSLEDTAQPGEVAAFQGIQDLPQVLLVTAFLIVLGHGLQMPVKPTGSTR